ncbi:MAG: peptide chain release factor N(5)-glutamine methyltransferase [Nitrospinae bacterium]|nr:peptide chain release factor N(5)-glutamine methyltransferase [Nitrospinota bacterium]
MNWTSSKILAWSAERLMKAGIGSPRLEAEILLAHAIRARRQDIYLEPDRPITRMELGEHQNLLRRRMSREPISHILGRREFWSLEFAVNSKVLAPRPETEVLVEKFLEDCRRKPQRQTRILDIGTGSGNIAATVARELPDCRVTAVDISPEALAVAERNAKTHGVSGRIRFLQSDLFENLAPADRFDYILSNPPYIASEDLRILMPDVKDYEPRLALDGGKDGLEFYRRIVPEAARRLENGGALVLEIGMDQALDVGCLIERGGNCDEPKVYQDYSGRDRVVLARRKNHG